MDQFDQATELEMRDRELAVSMARACADGPKATGRCLWCDEPLPGGREGGLRWCPATHPGESCMAEWEYEQKRRAAQ